MDLNERKKRRWAYPFFGLTDEYKIQLHELIFDLCYFGSLGYDAVYSMPIQYRTFYMRKLSNIKEKERDQYKGSMGKQESTPSKIVKGPGIDRH